MNLLTYCERRTSSTSAGGSMTLNCLVRIQMNIHTKSISTFWNMDYCYNVPHIVFRMENHKRRLIFYRSTKLRILLYANSTHNHGYASYHVTIEIKPSHQKHTKTVRISWIQHSTMLEYSFLFSFLCLLCYVCDYGLRIDAWLITSARRVFIRINLIVNCFDFGKIYVQQIMCNC